MRPAPIAKHPGHLPGKRNFSVRQHTRSPSDTTRAPKLFFELMHVQGTIMQGCVHGAGAAADAGQPPGTWECVGYGSRGHPDPATSAVPHLARIGKIAAASRFAPISAVDTIFRCKLLSPKSAGRLLHQVCCLFLLSCRGKLGLRIAPILLGTFS